MLIISHIDAAKFKNSDDAFSKKFESRQQLESYISRVEEITSDPTMSLKLKRGTKEKELALKRLVTKAMSTR